MAFGLNRAEVIGRLGADVTVNHLTSGGRVANLSIATDESYIDKQSGERVDRTEWHRVVTFQPGLVDMFEKHARKGRLVHAEGKLQTRRWKRDGEGSVGMAYPRSSPSRTSSGPPWALAMTTAETSPDAQFWKKQPACASRVDFVDRA